MKEHLHYSFWLIFFLIIHLSFNITISHIFYDFLLIFCYLFYCKRVPEYKFKNTTQQKFLIKHGQEL